MITILVTGSKGQLGKCLQDISINTADIKWIFKSSHELDITDEHSIRGAFKNNKIDYLINCAAYTAVDKAETEKEKAFLVNAEGVKFLVNACKEYDVTLIHISTDFVFDGKKTTPYLETDKPNPINVYGASKLKGEQYIQEILVKYYIIRTSWVYSEHGNNFVKTMLRLANERDKISVVNDQIGSPTYAGDLAKAILEIMLNDNAGYGIYHYSNEGEISWFDFAKVILILSKSGIECNPIISKDYPTQAIRPKYSVLDKVKIKKFFKIEIPVWTVSLENCLVRKINL